MKYTNIEWCDHTFNPWEGCTKVSPGCANCYAEARNKRWAGGANWGPGAPRRRTSEANWRQPIAWNRLQETSGAIHHGAERPRVFCASLADWLDDEVPIEWLADLLDLIRRTPNLDWLLLTKRPENWRQRILDAITCLGLRASAQFASNAEDNGNRDALAANWISEWIDGHPPANVWIGTTVEDQKRADERIPALLKIPARVRFLSCEPLLGPVDIEEYLEDQLDGGYVLGSNPVHWVICGGESGPKARQFVVEWADDLRRQCSAAGVAFFMKQLGANPRTSNANALDWPEQTRFDADALGAGLAASARVVLYDRVKGGDMEEFPEELKVRKHPLP